MRKSIVITAYALAMVMAACSNKKSTKVSVTPTPHSANRLLVEKGRNDAKVAMAFDSGSTERINAILEIHAKAYELSQQGMPNCAEDYLNGAKEVIGSKLLNNK